MKYVVEGIVINRALVWKNYCLTRLLEGGADILLHYFGDSKSDF
jgi:hypothetical protein